MTFSAFTFLLFDSGSGPWASDMADPPSCCSRILYTTQSTSLVDIGVLRAVEEVSLKPRKDPHTKYYLSSRLETRPISLVLRRNTVTTFLNDSEYSDTEH